MIEKVSETQRNEYSPPWGFQTSNPDGASVVARRREITPRPFVVPKIYGRIEFPRANGALGPSISAPELIVIKTDDCIMMPRHIIMSKRTGKLIPQSFLRGRTRYHGGLELDENSGYIPSFEMAAFSQVDAEYYHADTDFPTIWGHFLTDMLSRLWGVSEVGHDVKIATTVKFGSSHFKIMDAIGINRDRLVFLDGPVLPKIAYLPTPAIRLRNWVHPTVFELYDKVSRLGLLSTVTTPERIFVSRSKVEGRRLSNEAEVEAFFEGKGFQIIHPQDHAIEDQIRIFANAKLIVGVGGSAMHNTVFSSDRARILTICSSGWLTVIDALLSQTEGRLGYVFGDIAPGYTASSHKHQKPWVVDMQDLDEASRHHFGV